MRIRESRGVLKTENITVFSKKKDYIIYNVQDRDDSMLTLYKVFPGIDIIYNDIHIGEFKIKDNVFKDIIEISHCREGRIECEFEDKYFYLSPGDLAISRNTQPERVYSYPLNHYHGITILIDINKTPKCLSCFLEDVKVCPSVIMEKFCEENGYYVARSEKSIEHIFSELYEVPDSIKRGYLKVKTLELLLFLSAMNLDRVSEEKVSYSKSQVILAKDVYKYLMDNMEKHITIPELSKRFHVSDTLLKNSFKGVYGVSIYSYIREQKMHSAAISIKGSDLTILDIASKYGYENASKFSEAFKRVIGMSPNEYRSK